MIELGVFSLWTGTTKFKLTRANAMLFSAAVAFGNSALPDTELVTDARGLEIADRLGWQFRSFALALNDFCPRSAQHVWMLGKLEAQRIQVRPFIHVDLDLLLFSSLPARLASARLMTQGKDNLGPYLTPSARELASAVGIDRNAIPFNTSLIGWNDLGLMRSYCDKAMSAAVKGADRCSRGWEVSIVCEQLLLGDMARKIRLRVEEAIPMPINIQEWESHDISFAHLWGESKLDRASLHAVESRFSNDHPEPYDRFLKGFEKIK